MVDVAQNATDTIETRDDLGKDDAATVQYWLTQDKIAEKEERTWIKRARTIVKRYRDERPSGQGAAAEAHRFNILWSNVQTLKPLLYGRTPKPDVERRFKDADPVGRLAAQLLERTLAYSLDTSDFDTTMKQLVEDRLLPGRGVARVMYVPYYGDPLPSEPDEDASDDAGEGANVANAGDAGKQAKSAQPDREVVFEEARVKYVFWEDYREGPARTWDEVPWVRYRSYLTREQLIERFGSEKGKRVNLDFTPKGGEKDEADPAKDIFKKAEVWEIWDKLKRETIWIAQGTPNLVLDKLADPLKLQGFFPSPDPLWATTTTDKRVPVPDFIEYQDQAREMDALSARIDKLTKALKVAGVYAADEKQALQQLLDEGTENKLIPVEDWASFMGDKGGPEKLIAWLPIQQIAEVLIQLYNARDRSKQVLYEISGIADIMRGATNPSETYGAQELKAKFGTSRLSDSQKAVAQFARDTIRLMAGVIAEHFSPQTISMVTGFPQLKPVPAVPPQPTAPMPPLSLPGPAMNGAALPPPSIGAGLPPASVGPGAAPTDMNGASPAPPTPPAPAMGPPGAPQGAPGGPPEAPPAPPPDPAQQAYQQAMGQWQEAQAAAQEVQDANAKLQQQFDDAVALLKKDAAHDFRIDIEADSTILPDQQAEQQSRVEFLQAIVPLLEQIVPMAQGNPTLADLAKEIGLFAVRGFRVARPLEEAFEKAFDSLGKMPPPPDKNAPQGQQQGDEPSDMAKVAVAAKGVDAKAAAATQANAIKQAQVQGELAIKDRDQRADQAYHQGKLMIEEQNIDAKRSFRRMEELGMAAKSAEGLQ